MYAALWRVLPGPTWARTVTLLVLFVVLALALFLHGFPAVEPLLPFDTITLEGE